MCQDIAHAFASVSHKVSQNWQWTSVELTTFKMGQGASSVDGLNETVALNLGIADSLLTLAIQAQEYAKSLVRIEVWQVQLSGK